MTNPVGPAPTTSTLCPLLMAILLELTDRPINILAQPICSRPALDGTMP
jgi:hypothetical protein